jgi:hypothetical protein
MIGESEHFRTESPPRAVSVKAHAAPIRKRLDALTQDELLDEALKETFPASDPISVYRIE